MKSLKVVLRIVLIATMLSVMYSVVTQSTQAIEPNVVVDEVDHGDTGTDEADKNDESKLEENPGIIENLVTLAFLILLQAVLGFDNLLYISLESKHAPIEKQQAVRSWGIGIAIFLRIGLLCFLVYLREWFEQTSLFQFAFPFATGNFNVQSLIVLAGGSFIIYTAMKEIWHMTRLEHDDHGGEDKKKKSVNAIIFWIVLMNLVFSFDSILSAMALTKVFWVMAAAIIVSGIAMIWLSDRVSNFLAKNRMYEVLGLFVLFVVGIMLVSEGGHHAHLTLFGSPVTPMSKTTFYFVLAVMVLTDVVQSRYQQKLLRTREIILDTSK